jgi:thiamine pyrophosphate-dependent acetolactate synthase large subunit-like protein
MAANGNKVSQKELYAAIIAQSEERQEMERRLGDKIDTCIAEIRRQNTDQAVTIAGLCTATSDHEKWLGRLDGRDKLGSILSGVGIAIGTALGIAIAPKQ